jgi:hypothetical protein
LARYGWQASSWTEGRKPTFTRAQLNTISFMLAPGTVGETLLETRPTSLDGLSALNHGLKLVRPIDATAH